MKKIIINILLLLAVCAALPSCWKESYPMSSDRYQVRNLVAIADDATVALKWDVPEQMTPCGYVISYINTESESVTLKLDDATPSASINNLVNGNEYTFKVQAVYQGGEVSGQVAASAKPMSRSPQGFRVTDSGNQYLSMVWTKPVYADLQSFRISYGYEGSEVKKVDVEADKESYTLTELVNDKEYTMTVSAVYPEGRIADSAPIKGTPTNIIPWTASKMDVVAGEPVLFKYDQGMLPATEVTWDIPGVGQRTGDEVTASLVTEYNVQNNDKKNVTVKVSAKVGASVKSWDINMTVRPFLFLKKDWDKGSSSYQGFKNDAPVFSPDGKTIYVMGFAKPAILYALDAVTGEEKWHYAPSTASAGYNGKTVNPVTGDIYFGNSTAGHFYCVKADGTLKWDKTGLGSMNQTSFPAVNKAGTVVYVHDASKVVTAINAADGTTIWQKTMSAKGGGLIVNGDELIVGCCASSGGVQFLKVSDGSTIASVDLPANMSDGGGFAVSPDRKTAYLGTTVGSVCAIDIVNHSLIASDTPTQDLTNCNIWELAVSPSGDVFGGSKRGYMFCYADQLASKKWEETTMAKVANGFNYAHPCCDAEGNFLITSGGNRNQNFKISPAGGVLKQWSALDDDNQKQMSGNAFHNGIFYSAFLGGGSANGALVAVYVGGEDATSGWPCHGGDLCGSCCIK